MSKGGSIQISVKARWGGIVGFWLAEAGTKTKSAPKFRQMELSLKKLIGLCYATDELLQDVAALETAISIGFKEEIAFQTDNAIMRGSGVGQPMGYLTSPCLVSVTRSASATVASADVINMWTRHSSPTKATWLINPSVLPELLRMSLGVSTAGGALTFMPPGGLSSPPYASLLGRPIVLCELCPVLGTAGDIALCDFNEYLLIEKGGIQTSSSIHVSFVSDESVFRFVYRCDGQPTWNAPLTPFQGSSTTSPFVVLTTL